jgi:hypothetical protein
MPPGAPVGPPGGNVGNLMVGAADGLGGKVIRTVSFFGWTLPVDFFIGVTGAPGTPGGRGGCESAICFQIKVNPAIKVSNQITHILKFFRPAKAGVLRANQRIKFLSYQEKKRAGE